MSLNFCDSETCQPVNLSCVTHLPLELSKGQSPQLESQQICSAISCENSSQQSTLVEILHSVNPDKELDNYVPPSGKHLDKNVTCEVLQNESNISKLEEHFLDDKLKNADFNVSVDEFPQIQNFVAEYDHAGETNSFNVQSFSESAERSFPHPVFRTSATRCFMQKSNNFLKGCKWSPDGTFLLTCSDDNFLRVFRPDLSHSPLMGEMECLTVVREAETVYDYAWACKSDIPLFASVARSQPIHLWDANTGLLHGTLISKNHLDEPTSAYALQFFPDGASLYCGFKDYFNIIDLSTHKIRKVSTVENGVGLGGIISCFSFNPTQRSQFALGTYKRTVGIYECDELCYILDAHLGGVTHLCYSKCGRYLFSGGRKDRELMVWDLRRLNEVLCVIPRTVSTNQRVYFDLSACGNFLFSGSSSGEVSVTDVRSVIIQSPEFICRFQAHNDCTNGISCHPQKSILATTSGQRHFPPLSKLIRPQNPSSSSGSDASDEERTKSENSLKLWNV